MILFLDFDGVLHPVLDEDKFQHMDRFLRLLDDYPEVKIVISSSWRHVLDYGVMKGMLERHEDKFLGTTRDVLEQENDCTRLLEILSWIEDHGYSGPWLAIDDAVSEFPLDYPNLFLCKSEVGLNEETVEKLRQRLKDLHSKIEEKEG